jgi:preprotein translocase subunit SecA
MLSINVAENGDDEENQENILYNESKNYYKANVVYGEVSQFQFDILDEEYNFGKGRLKRPFDFVIVDEVDSMMIDESSKVNL